MNKDCTTSEAADVLRLIKEHGPVLAIEIADRLGFTGSRETKRRHVRAIVQHLRNECGEMIVANAMGGYYLTNDKTIWQSYLNGRQIEAKIILSQTHKKLKMVTDSKGQGLLFLPGVGSLNNSQFQRSAV